MRAGLSTFERMAAIVAFDGRSIWCLPAGFGVFFRHGGMAKAAADVRGGYGRGPWYELMADPLSRKR